MNCWYSRSTYEISGAEEILVQICKVCFGLFLAFESQVDVCHRFLLDYEWLCLDLGKVFIHFKRFV